MKILSLFAFAIIAASCSSQKIDHTLSNFEADRQPYAQSWTGGIPGSGSGVNLYLPFSDQAIKNMETVYFKGMMTNLVEADKVSGKYIVARFQTDFNQQPDMNMALDPNQEYGNKSPKKEEKFPFELDDDEAVVKVASKGKYIYTKIKGIKMKSSMDLPSRPQ